MYFHTGLVPGASIEVKASGKRYVTFTRLPRSWSAAQLNDYILSCFPRVMTFKFKKGVTNSIEMEELPAGFQQAFSRPCLAHWLRG